MSLESVKADFERKYPFCNFIINHQAGLVAVVIDNFEFGVFSSISPIRPNENFISNFNTFNKLEKKMIEKGYNNLFATVNTDGSIYFSNSEGQALEEKKDNNAYIGLVGSKNKNNQYLGVLLLLSEEMHPDFGKTRNKYPKPLPCTGTYVNRTRRWLKVSVERDVESYFEDLFRDEYFVIDTGAPYSYILEKHLKDLKHTVEPIPETIHRITNVEEDGVNVEKEVVYITPRITTKIEGSPITFVVTDDNYWRENVRGINLLGTNFINEFYMSDDFHSEQIRFMKPAYKKPASQSSISAFV